MSEQTIEQVRETFVDEWMDIPGVQGVGISVSNNKPCFLILSSVEAQQLREMIPSTVQGYSVIIEETGTVSALDPPQKEAS